MRLNRRQALIGASASLALPWARPSYASPGSVNVYNWADYIGETTIEDFANETGIDIVYDLYASAEEMEAKMLAGSSGYDVVLQSGLGLHRLVAANLYQKIDRARLQGWDTLNPEILKVLQGFDPDNAHGVPYTWGTTGLCYRTDLVKGSPESWNDLLKPSDELKGKITMLSTDRWLMAAGFLANGMSVNTTEQADLDKVRDQLIETKRQLLAFDDTTFYSKLVSGEASLVHAWDGWCNYGIAEKPEIKYVIPKEGSDLWVDTIVVVADSENQDAAHTFINYILKPETGKWARTTSMI
jgi:spermidine/putrescine transport system substrate-binding protein